MAAHRVLLVLVFAAVCNGDLVSDDIGVPRSVTEGDLIRELRNRDVKSGLPKSSAPFKVSLGLYAEAVTEVNVEKGYVEIVAFLSMRWTDPRLRFRYSPPFIAIQDVRLSTTDLWWPDVELYDVVAPGMQMLNMRNEVVVDYNGNVTWYPLVSLRSVCEDLASNKTEVKCRLKFGSWTYTRRLFDLQPITSQDIMSEYRSTGQWTITSVAVERTEEKYDCCPEYYVFVYFTFSLKQRDI